MTHLNCLIVDDEELARMLLENYVGRLPHLKIIGKCANPLEALSVMQTHSIDILFLDIQMPKMAGTEFLKTLSQKPMVIFTTAYSEYALEGYELDVVDYLLKPFTFERFLQAVNKAHDLWKLKQAGSAGKKNDSDEIDYILVKSDYKVFRLFYSDILYIESMQEYVAFHIAGKRILSLGSLKSLADKLPTNQFIRVHRSYIVAKRRVTTLEGNMVHIGTNKIPIGASYRESVMIELF